MESPWWRPELNDKGLSQGDVIEAIAFAYSVNPTTRLKRASGKRGETWEPTSASPKRSTRQHFLFEGKEARGLVISHSCELDKPKDRPRVLVAPIGPITALGTDAQERVLSQKSVRFMPLPNLPGIGTSYVDLRTIVPVNRKLIPESARLVSMSDAGVDRLQAQLVLFLTRKSVPG